VAAAPQYDGYGDAGDGLDWHELDDVYETSISIKKLVDLDGGLLRSKMKIDEEDLEENLIQGGDPFEGVKNRKEEYEGFTGNSVRLPFRVEYEVPADRSRHTTGPDCNPFLPHNRKLLSSHPVTHEM
jgi:hypothetical protein